MKTNKVLIDINAAGSGRVLVNGVDVSKIVCGLEVRASVGDKTTVLLELAASAVEINAEADAILAAASVQREIHAPKVSD